MPADFIIKQGDTEPIFAQQIIDSTGAPVNLTSATATLVLRPLASAQPIELTGAVTIFDAPNGKVQWTPSAQDTAQAGALMGNWQITFANGAVQSYPTSGYLWINVEPNLAASAQQIVGLEDAKDYTTAYGAGIDRSHDAKLLRYINAATPMIENMVGPVIVRTFDEWHAGGQYFIQLRRRPSSALGTTPVLNILGCDEYRGQIKYPLSLVADPTAATIYSVMLEPRRGTLVRRTTGGGVIPFGAGAYGGAMPEAVHVVYQAGQQTVPENVRLAALEYVRWSYMSTQGTGMGSRSIADQEDMTVVGTHPGMLPPSALQLLAPMRKHPAIG